MCCILLTRRFVQRWHSGAENRCRERVNRSIWSFHKIFNDFFKIARCASVTSLVLYKFSYFHFTTRIRNKHVYVTDLIFFCSFGKRGQFETMIFQSRETTLFEVSHMYILIPMNERDIFTSWKKFSRQKFPRNTTWGNLALRSSVRADE